jgi:hypothetical protein
MRNLIFYYFVILLPIPILFWTAKTDRLLFVFLLVAYIIFRNFFDGQKLINKNIIEKKELWKAFIPFWRSRYFKELYFEK